MLRLRKRRPSVMESLTEPPLESRTTVAPARSRPRENSSKSRGLSAVTMPTALTQPLQLGLQSIQLKRIGSLRSSSVLLAFAALPDGVTAPGNAKQRAVAPISARPRSSSVFISFNLDPSPSPSIAAARAPKHDMILSSPRYQNGSCADGSRP